MGNKFSLKKFNKDRQASYERSKKGELRDAGLLPDKSGIHSLIEGTIQRIRVERHQLHQKAEVCQYKLALGCKLSKNRRTKPECEACL